MGNAARPFAGARGAAVASIFDEPGDEEASIINCTWLCTKALAKGIAAIAATPSKEDKADVKVNQRVHSEVTIGQKCDTRCR